MNEDVNGYLRKAKDCLIDSDYLLRANRLEAACNRSYYAIYDSILSVLAFTENTYFKTHQGAHNRFRELYIKTGLLPIYLNESLSKALELRQGADYELDFEISNDVAHAMFEEAKIFVTQIESYLNSLTQK